MSPSSSITQSTDSSEPDPEPELESELALLESGALLDRPRASFERSLPISAYACVSFFLRTAFFICLWGGLKGGMPKPNAGKMGLY